MIKVFYESRLFEIGEEVSIAGSKNPIHVEDRFELFVFLNEYFKIKNQPDVFVYGYNPKKLFKDFQSYFKFIHAAGGIVKNEKKQVLFIKRKGIWDLPKGKLENKEKPKRGAVREVKEETGVKKLKASKKLAPTYHIFKRNRQIYLKKTDWYLMEASGKSKLVPEKKEGITKVAWFDKQKAISAISESHRSLRESFMEFMNGSFEK